MALPAALAPLRHPIFRMLWITNLVVSFGVWMQNTGAGWLMATLAPDSFTVSLVSAATILPVFLLAMPAGALADIVDKRLFIIATQSWMLGVAAILALLTYAGWVGSSTLLMLTFALGLGAAMNNPAWGSVLSESVPRRDLVQAITLNGVGFNLARAIGPALAGVLIVFGGPELAFALNALSYLAVIGVLLSWRRTRVRSSSLPRENLISAMRAGARFVRHSPVMRAAMARTACFFFPAAAPWAMLPLVVKEQLGLGAGSFGILLGLMGSGGVTAGMLLPQVRARLSRGTTVFVASLSAMAGIALLGSAHHWAQAALAMVLFGVGWVASSSVAQGAAQLAAPSWVRSRALAIYQLGFNFALGLGTFFWGWLGTHLGLQTALLAAAGTGLLLALLARRFDIDREPVAAPPSTPDLPAPEAVDPDLVAVMPRARGHVLESQRYRILPADRAGFLAAMAELRNVRGRAGAIEWQIYEDIAHADEWMEVWEVENWSDHLREASRMGDADRAAIARAMQFHQGDPIPPSRFLAVSPRPRRPADPPRRNEEPR
ncbi:MAG: MFS transporter [Alphaproteobacteria bacterium]|nr:MFS transporter [Alphaproteobacteria bacterium]